MKSPTSTECNLNLGVDKELQDICYIDAVPCEQNRKAIQRQGVIYKENQQKTTLNIQVLLIIKNPPLRPEN